MLRHLDAALNRAGHHSIVIAPEGYDVEGILVEMPRPETPLNEAGEEQVRAQYRATIEMLLSTWRFDVIHLHGFDSDECLPHSNVPIVVTPKSDTGVSLNTDPGRPGAPGEMGQFVENYVATYHRLAGERIQREREAQEQQQSFAV